MEIWDFITNQFLVSQDGISVSWAFVAGMFAIFWIKRSLVSMGNKNNEA